MLLTAFKEKPGNLARAFEADSEENISWGRSRTNVFSNIPETKSEIKLNTLSDMNMQSKKGQTKTKELVLLSNEDIVYCLSFFDGQMIATVLEDTMIQLKILDECSTKLQLTKTLAELPTLKRLHFKVTEPFDPCYTTDEISAIDPNKLDCIEYKIHKFCKDRDSIAEFVTTLYVELSTKRCFNELADYVSNILDKKELYKFLQEAEAKNKILCKELRKQLRNQRNRIKTLKYDADVAIQKLVRKIDDENLLIEIRDRHVTNWENARTEQHDLTVKEKEAMFRGTANYYRKNADSEQRVHAEIEILTNIIIAEALNQIGEWMVKYDTDVEAIDLKIQVQRNAYAAMKDKRMMLEQTINLHNKQLLEWNRFKEEREMIQLYHDTMQKSAIMVQAWWRGIIVRRHLGPFRPKRKTHPKK